MKRRPLSNALIASSSLPSKSKSVLQMLRQPSRVVALGDDSNLALRSPAQQHLRRSAAMLLRNTLNDIVIKQQQAVLHLLEVQLQETQRTERRVRSNGNTLLLRIVGPTEAGR